MRANKLYSGLIWTINCSDLGHSKRLFLYPYKTHFPGKCSIAIFPRFNSAVYLKVDTTKGRDPLPNQMIFWKSCKGGVIFNPKIYVADYGNFEQDFWIMKLIQKSNFRVQGMLFNNCIEKNQNKTHFEEGSSSHTSLRDGSSYQIGNLVIM